jgi:hypothetical protein
MVRIVGAVQHNKCSVNTRLTQCIVPAASTPHRHRCRTSSRGRSGCICSWTARADTRGPSWAHHTGTQHKTVAMSLRLSVPQPPFPPHLAAAVVASVPVMRLGRELDVVVVAVLQLAHEAPRRVRARHRGHGAHAVVHHTCSATELPRQPPHTTVKASSH